LKTSNTNTSPSSCSYYCRRPGWSPMKWQTDRMWLTVFPSLRPRGFSDHRSSAGTGTIKLCVIITPRN
jgi:hypothetical protein